MIFKFVGIPMSRKSELKKFAYDKKNPCDIPSSNENLHKYPEKHEYICCGSFWPNKTYALFNSLIDLLADETYGEAIPHKIIAVGSGMGLLERFFEISGFSVTCYDKSPRKNGHIKVKEAEFPRDIKKILPEDCSNIVLFSGYPEGYLGPITDEFTRRGGEYIIITAFGSLSYDHSMHFGYESDDGESLKSCLNNLLAKERDSFRLYPGKDYDGYGPGTGVEFYNFPIGTEKFMQENIRQLNGWAANSFEPINKYWVKEDTLSSEEESTATPDNKPYNTSALFDQPKKEKSNHTKSDQSFNMN